MKTFSFYDQILSEGRFEKGMNPKRSLNLGLCQKVFGRCGKDFSEGGAYSFDAYGPENWMDIISWLLDQGYNDEETEQIMRSKLLRWASDKAPEQGIRKYGNVNLEDFLKYNNKLVQGKTNVDYFLDEYFPDKNRKERLMRAKTVQEDAMGGVSAPMATLNNTPGMGNAIPASAASTGALDGAPKGSGDSWDSSTGIKPAVQESFLSQIPKIMILAGSALALAYTISFSVKEFFENKKIRKILEKIMEKPEIKAMLLDMRKNKNPSNEKIRSVIGKYLSPNDKQYLERIDYETNIPIENIVNEMNINPHDKLGVAMAKKMGIDIPFKKGKGDKDVEQKRIDKDIDLSTKLMTFEEWAKKFVNE